MTYTQGAIYITNNARNNYLGLWDVAIFKKILTMKNEPPGGCNLSFKKPLFEHCYAFKR
jgi:hypothetical protein